MRPPFGGFGPGFGPGGRGGGHGRGGGRGRRGNVRAAVLGLLKERPMHGYEMISELEARTGGVWRPSPGSIYPTLQLLEDEGLIVSEESGGRKRFSLTEAGQAEAARTTDNGGRPPWQQFDAEHIAEAQEFRQAGVALMEALRQIGISGTEAQRQAALEVLVDARRRLYTILAE
ncbi:helix-turn-helix transcriptional regulator [Catellatospora sp. KI3]|uniref:PadR family transcriptional regulator n=1 Tax=Catellatospora sp. KI3 TaxID=3041620 RepID=UPI002482E696|nr:helix-turn-helix transcriptional regulator [Catellatospora sp. KI3]MDI1459443.1 helix-turn-helix transcriptional regulator [Catellatospora sp. KI3]